jgi:hypothetical protein
MSAYMDEKTMEHLHHWQINCMFTAYQGRTSTKEIFIPTIKFQYDTYC